MPSAKRRSKRKPIAWAAWLWAAFALNLVVGLQHSPITKPRVIRVTGATVEQRAHLEECLRALRGAPAAQVNRERLQARVLSLDSIAAASFQLNLFGRGTLEIVPHQPVALMGQNVALTAKGTAMTLAGEPPNLPKLEVSDNLLRPSLSLAANWQPTRVAAICRELAQADPETALLVRVSDRGMVEVQPVEGGARVIFGSADKWEEKVQALRLMLDKEESFWARFQEVNLTVPGTPMVVR